MSLRFAVLGAVILSSITIYTGLWFIVGVLGLLVFLVSSSAFGLLHETQNTFSTNLLDNFMPYKINGCFNCQQMKFAAENQKLSLDKRVSGSSVIDDALQDLLQYIIRDYVDIWFYTLSKESEFPNESRQFLQKIAINASNRCKEVDWLPFLTRRFVDSVIGHIRLYRKAKMKLKQKHYSNEESTYRMVNNNLLTNFFELESEMGGKKTSRKRITMDPLYERECLKILADFLLQLLGSKEELGCRPVHLLTSQILTGEIIIPLFDLLSDPDYINQTIIWLCKNSPLSSDSFLAVLRSTENLSELDASRELLTREIAILRSHDFGGEGDISIKRRLSSLMFVSQLIDNHIQEIKDDGNICDSFVSTQSYWNRYMARHGHSVYELPLDVCLKNSVALSYFLDFMANVESQVYVFFLINVEGWKIAANQQISQLRQEGVNIKIEYDHLKRSNSGKPWESNSPRQMLASLQESAMSIYQQYFSDNATSRLNIGEVIVRRLLFNLVNETPAETWFDEVASVVTLKIENEERFMPSFRKSVGYIRMLAELDLLKDTSRSDDEELRFFDEQSTSESSSIWTDVDVKVKNHSSGDPNVYELASEESSCFKLTASISQKGVVKDGITSHAVYAVTVLKTVGDKEIDSWVVYRRYSDFHDFHLRLEERFKAMKELTFPAKRAFNNMDKLFLERRQYLLNEYLTKLLKADFLRINPGLQESLLQFFDRGSYEHTKGSISRKVDTLINPLVSSMRTVTKVVRMESPSFLTENSNDGSLYNEQTLSGMSIYGDDQYPLRVLLILMDEIFDLQNRNQWLRKRVFYMLREILRAMFGDVFNQKIVDYVDSATSPDQVAELIRLIKDSFWPSGVPAMPRPSRDEATRMRTRVAAKMSLLSWFSDEIKHLIGSETAREGVLRLFELFQNPILNRRLLYVILEGVIDTLFPENNIDGFYENLYSDTN